MGTSEKKRAREQNAAARRERAVKKRTEKSAVTRGAMSGSSTGAIGTGTPEGTGSDEIASRDTS
jgi:hypothetical protein